ncbi:phage head closure protein [Bacillus sp. SJS]|uniref:phage head closure protein n=1 Tax=Bacillus sp. SJS TaxID=1423321 RepID=UPI0004DD7096|nr:phage head closure protein [Bacillus sp. SJS]KZZ86229.1 hypothetical protein AS29_001245 [Bacillus sp. SJS]
MNPGQLNSKISIKGLTRTSDNAGGYEDKFEVIKYVWAFIKPISGREYYQAQQSQSVITHTFVVRYDAEIDRTQVIEYQGRKFDIQYIINVDEQNRYLEIQALEQQ